MLKESNKQVIRKKFHLEKKGENRKSRIYNNLIKRSYFSGQMKMLLFMINEFISITLKYLE